MATANTQPQGIAGATVTDRAITVLREALEHQQLCDPDLDIGAIIAHAIAHPDDDVVDSFASAEILSALDEVFGSALPKEVLSHRSLATLGGLRRSLQILEARYARNQKTSPKRT
jgi:acyl carrier protein